MPAGFHYRVAMDPRPSRMHALRNAPLQFTGSVLRGFRRNQGFLLAGAIAYNTLLSLVPACALMLVVLSHVVPEDRLFPLLNTFLELIAPAQAQELTQQLQLFLQDRRVVGIVGFVALLFFSSLAFTVLENAMAVIFFHRARVHRRHFLFSAVLPYLYIMLLTLGLLLVSIISSMLHVLQQKEIHVLGLVWTVDLSHAWLVYLFGVAGEIVLLTSLYLGLPHGRLRLRHALAGGVAATVLWEITRHILVWYFASLSLVNVIYGSFAAVIVVLLSLEVAAVIVLLGAQVIAEYERLDQAEATRTPHWHER